MFPCNPIQIHDQSQRHKSASAVSTLARSVAATHPADAGFASPAAIQRAPLPLLGRAYPRHVLPASPPPTQYWLRLLCMCHPWFRGASSKCRRNAKVAKRCGRSKQCLRLVHLVAQGARMGLTARERHHPRHHPYTPSITCSPPPRPYIPTLTHHRHVQRRSHDCCTSAAASPILSHPYTPPAGSCLRNIPAARLAWMPFVD